MLLSKAKDAHKRACHMRKLVGKDELNPRYTVIWGSLFRTYTGTMACTGLHHVSVRTKKEARRRAKLIARNFSDLIHAIDLRTGKQVLLNV